MTIYRLLLLAFPKHARREFGDDMTRMFAAQLDEARASGASVTRLWVRAVSDALWHGFVERAVAAAALGKNVNRDIRRWRWWMHALRQDLSYAGRMMIKQPGVTAIVIATLAIGIGANAAIFSAVDALLVRPLPFDQPDRLVMIWEKRASEGVLNNVVAPADYLDWARLNTVFESTAAFTPTTADLTGAGDAIRLFAGAVSPPLFDVLHVRMALGRTFLPDEVTLGRHRVVILSHGLWQRRFGGVPGVVGTKILLSGIPHEVVGVLPQTFEFPDSTIEIWMPLVLEGGAEAPSRANHFLNVYARLKEGTTVERARTDMDRLAAQLSAEYPDSNARHGAWVVSLRDQLLGPIRASLLLLLAAVAFVLLIACVNVANILLARAAMRRREIAVRAALGAGRGRLVRQALTESLVLGLLGGIAGLIVARWGIEILKQVAPDNVPVLGLERLGLDMRVIVFSFGLSLLTGALFGLLPAWHFASMPLNDALKDGSRSQGGVRKRLRLSLVVSEIALASLLLVGAGLTLRSFYTVLGTEAGFTTKGVLTTLIALPPARYGDNERRLSTFEQIEARFRAIPGVRSVGATIALPLSGQDGRRGIAVEGFEATDGAPTRAHPRAITTDYFRTMGMQLVAGRGFSSGDRADAPLVVIVNETMARRYWPGSSPLGKRVRFVGNQAWREVIGIVRDVRHWGLDRPVNPEMYCPLPQLVFSGVTFALATEGDPSAFAGVVREELRRIDPDLPLSSVRTMDEVAAASVAPHRAGTSVLGAFGIVALILAAAGIYGVMSHLVALRTSEIGVRVTMGAQRADIMRLVLKEGLLQALVGLTIGLAAAVLLMKSFRTLLYEVSPADPITLVSVAAILLGTALIACVVPALRAMHVDPVTALRQ